MFLLLSYKTTIIQALELCDNCRENNILEMFKADAGLATLGRYILNRVKVRVYVLANNCRQSCYQIIVTNWCFYYSATKQ